MIIQSKQPNHFLFTVLLLFKSTIIIWHTPLFVFLQILIKEKKNTAVVLSTAISKLHIILEKYIFVLIAVYNTVHFV